MLKGKIVISTEEILKAIEEAEEATAAKKSKKTTGRPRGRPRKNAPASVVALENAESGEGSECE